MKTHATYAGDPRHHATDLAELRAENERLTDIVDDLRSDVGRLTRERDEWEANEQTQAREVERLNAVIDGLMRDHPVVGRSFRVDL